MGICGGRREGGGRGRRIAVREKVRERGRFPDREKLGQIGRRGREGSNFTILPSLNCHISIIYESNWLKLKKRSNRVLFKIFKDNMGYI